MIELAPKDVLRFPIPFRRRQFPIRPWFAITINKAHGQMLDRVGIYLPQAIFSHGQLYVAEVLCSQGVEKAPGS